MQVNRSMSPGRSAGLRRQAKVAKPAVAADASIPGTAPRAMHRGAAPAANTVALSDGTRISFHAVEELSEQID